MRNKVFVHCLHRTSSTYFTRLLSEGYKCFKEPFHPSIDKIYEDEKLQGDSYTRSHSSKLRHVGLVNKYTENFQESHIRLLKGLTVNLDFHNKNEPRIFKAINEMFVSSINVAIIDMHLWKIRPALDEIFKATTNVFLVRNPVDWIISCDSFSIGPFSNTKIDYNQERIDLISLYIDCWVDYISAIKLCKGDVVIDLDRFTRQHNYRELIISLISTLKEGTFSGIPEFELPTYIGSSRYSTIACQIKSYLNNKSPTNQLALYFLNKYNLVG